ncbi:MAG: hypothetical protein KF823_07000 [Xanthomonadales bacterium]|nr:hypothetical protein [Xanthomonadales bacterium]
MNHLARSLFAAVGLLFALSASAQIVLQPGATYSLEMSPNSLLTNTWVEVPEQSRQLIIELRPIGSGNVDLMTRYGSPFPFEGNAGTFGGLDWLMEHAHYRSFSRGGDHRITVTRAQPIPLRAGRWYVSALNVSNQQVALTLRVSLLDTEPGPVQFQTVFNDEDACAANGATAAPWTDPTPATPVAGNLGTTLGQQRLIAFNRAATLLGEQLRGTAPVRILACWKDLGGTASDAVLASAGPEWVFRDEGLFAATGQQNRWRWQQPSLPSSYTWYTSAATAQLSGTDACRTTFRGCDDFDIYVQFNTAVDGNTVLGSRRFHYGLDAAPGPGGNLDFIGTAMHEVTHGLGFLALINFDPAQGPIGEKLRVRFPDGTLDEPGHNDAFSDQLAWVDGNTVTEFNRLTLAQRIQAMISRFNLRWFEAQAVTSPQNNLRLQPYPLNLPPVYTPTDLQPGSSVSHLDPDMTPSLMGPNIRNGIRDLGLAGEVLGAVGWSDTPRPARVHPMPFGGQWFDPARNGHGLDIYRVEGNPDTYLLTLYTFDANGLPEWYLTIGRIVDGVFRPGNDANGNSLWRTRYLFGPPPSQVADSSVRGQMRIDFNADQAERAPACNDGTGRNGPLALMTFQIGTTPPLRWCLTQIVAEADRPVGDRTGHWAAAALQDRGWGLTTLNFLSPAGHGLFTILYFPDSEGRPRWAAAQTNDFQPGQTQPLFQIQGYCRTCPMPAGGTTPVQIGELRIDAGSDGSGSAQFTARFQGAGNSEFIRGSLPLTRLGGSAPAGD